MEAEHIMTERHEKGGAEERYKEMRKTQKRSHRKEKRHSLKKN